jgi:hypothetical protein
LKSTSRKDMLALIVGLVFLISVFNSIRFATSSGCSFGLFCQFYFINFISFIVL